MINKIIYFIQHGVWENEASGLVRPFKIALYTVRGIGQHNIFLRASALTYYTILSIVPILALIFGFMKGFGFDENLWRWVYEQFPGERAFVDDFLRDFIDKLLIHTRGGLIAAVGLAVLFWSVIRVFTTIEESFNNIWEVKKARGIARQLSDYLSVVIVAPILLISGATLGDMMKHNLEPWMSGWLIHTIFTIAELMLVWLLFAFVYWVMPNTKVRFKGALIAGTIAGTAFWVFQNAYFALQGGLNSSNAIYGTFAAIPLLLVWIQMSWVFALVGAELSFAYQNIDRYELERQATGMNATNKRKIVVAAMAVIAKHFTAGGGAVTAEQIATELGLPVRSVRDVVYELEEADLVVAIRAEHDSKSHAYMPARDVREMTVYDVVEAVENDNAGNLDVTAIPQLVGVSGLLDEARAVTKGGGMMTKIINL